jgi:hypothetical protein
MKFIDKSQLEQWGEIASAKFLESGIPLNDSIIKIASDNMLNAEQVKRIAEFANITTNLSMFEKAADKRFTFTQADAKAISERVSNTSEKTASPSGIYATAPDDFRNRSDYFNMTKEASPSELKEDAASEDANYLLDLLGKTEIAAQEIGFKKLASEGSIMAAEDSLYNDVKQYVLSGDNTFGEVCSICMEHGESPYDRNLIKEAMVKVGYKLAASDMAIKKSEVVKLANSVVEDYISNNLESPGAPVMIRNGNLNLYYTLDTLITQKERAASYDKPLLHLNDSVRYIKRKLINC